jgi:hypothetical protein
VEKRKALLYSGVLKKHQILVQVLISSSTRILLHTKTPTSYTQKLMLYTQKPTLHEHMNKIIIALNLANSIIYFLYIQFLCNMFHH